MHAIQANYRSVDLGPATGALLGFADKLTRDPQGMTRGDVESLRTQGFSDADVVDAAQLVGYFNYSNRVMDSLGIDPDPGMRFRRSE